MQPKPTDKVVCARLFAYCKRAMSVYSSATVKLEVKISAWAAREAEAAELYPSGPVSDIVVPVVAVSATFTVTQTHTLTV